MMTRLFPRVALVGRSRRFGKSSCEIRDACRQLMEDVLGTTAKPASLPTRGVKPLFNLASAFASYTLISWATCQRSNRMPRTYTYAQPPCRAPWSRCNKLLWECILPVPGRRTLQLRPSLLGPWPTRPYTRMRPAAVDSGSCLGCLPIGRRKGVSIALSLLLLSGFSLT